MDQNALNVIALWGAKRLLDLNSLTFESLTEALEMDRFKRDSPRCFFNAVQYTSMKLIGEHFWAEFDFGNVARGPHVSVTFGLRSSNRSLIQIDMLTPKAIASWDFDPEDFAKFRAVAEPLDMTAGKFCYEAAVIAEKVTTLRLMGLDGRDLGPDWEPPVEG